MQILPFRVRHGKPQSAIGENYFLNLALKKKLECRREFGFPTLEKHMIVYQKCD
jgi:hypothetical protein